jgi:hypothetical protein
MPICPACRTEYANPTDKCEICGISLVDALPEATDEVEAGIELLDLATFSNVSEAEMFKEILEKNEIRTIQKGEVDPIGITSGAAPVLLLVEARDLRRARELYETYFAGTDAIEFMPDQE